MKLKIKNVSLDYALSIEPPKRERLKKPSPLFSALIRVLSIPDMLAAKFTYTKERMELAGKGPYLILMNHSSFIDLKIASRVLFPKRYFIVTTSDAFIGKAWLMKKIGCIPTQKFTADVGLARDMLRAVKDKKTSVLLFPEAGYTFDGTTTTLPPNTGSLLKKMDVPVLTLITDGAFLRQPLYNDLRLRKNKVTAHLKCVLTREEIAQKSVEELDEIVNKAFSFDGFKSQQQSGLIIDDPERATGLHRLLYKCPHCKAEEKTVGKGVTLTCENCGKVYELTETGFMQAREGETEFPHIPDWFAWERACVREELENGSYKLDVDVEIGIMADYKMLYKVGDGKLTHDTSGFTLTGCEGKLHYTQSPLASYGLNADYYWYEIGDIISIGDRKRLYYCFPKTRNVVTKARFAAEELYKLVKASKQK